MVFSILSNDTNKTRSQGSRTTLMLEQLLEGYDKRLRPNFGGKVLLCSFNYLRSFIFHFL